jgi:hypothetical protein
MTGYINLGLGLDNPLIVHTGLVDLELSVSDLAWCTSLRTDQGVTCVRRLSRTSPTRVDTLRPTGERAQAGLCVYEVHIERADLCYVVLP